MIFTEISDSQNISRQHSDNAESLSRAFWTNSDMTQSLERPATKTASSDVMKNFGDLILIAEDSPKENHFTKLPTTSDRASFNLETGVELSEVLGEIEKGGKEPTKELLHQIGTHRMTILGEWHPQESNNQKNICRTFLSENIAELKAAGITTIALESDRRNQQAVTDFAFNQDPNKEKQLRDLLPDEIRNSPLEQNAIREAAKNGMKIVCTDDFTSRYDIPLRNAAIAQTLGTILMDPRERVVMLVGSGHETDDAAKKIDSISTALAKAYGMPSTDIFSVAEVDPNTTSKSLLPIINSVKSPVLFSPSEAPAFSRIPAVHFKLDRVPDTTYNKFDAVILP